MKKKGKKITLVLTIFFLFIVGLTVNANNISARIEIERPTSVEKVKQTLNYQGWMMSEDSNATVEAYIDGVKQTNPERVGREDVLKTITGYGGRSTNTKPGYRGSIDLTEVQDGVHNLTIKVLSQTGQLIKEENRVFNLKKYDAQSNLESPYSNQTISSTLNYRGWVMSEDKDAKVNIYLDDKLQQVPERVGREDVLKVITEYGGRNTNPKPGYKGSIDISNLPLGTKHRFRVEIVSSKGDCLEKKEVIVQVKKYKGKINIESPTINQKVKQTLNYQGWMMSEDSNATVEAYIDGVKQTNPERVGREDVLKTITGYGGRSTNTKPGYRGSIDLTEVQDGVHNLTIKVLSQTGQLIKEENRVFNLKKYETRIELEKPSNNQKIKTSIEVQGWVMSEDRNGVVEIYLDGVKQSNPERIGREDVLKAITGYGGRETNTKPGYKATIDSSGMKDGTHTIEVRYIYSESSEISKKVTTKFTIKKYDCKIYLESPKSNHFTSTINITGWEMSELDGSYVKAYIDTTDMNVSFKRTERDDVINAITGYGGKEVNPTPGFVGNVDIKTITAGKHKLTIRVYSKLNEVLYSYQNNICVKSCIPTYYNQKDQRWENVIFGLSSMGKTGCAPTSMAMAFSTILSKSILPIDIANYLYYNTDQFNKNMKGTSGLGIIYASNHYGVKYTPLISKQSLADALSSGKIVYAAMGNGKFATPLYNHAILLHGYSNGNTKSYDPLKVENNGAVSIEQVWNEQSKDYDDYRGGSNFYSLEGYY